MLSSILLLTFSTLALGLKAGDLTVSIKPVHTVVDSIDDIVISAVISNPTDSDIRVIAKNNILDSSPTRSFTVSKGGKNATFTGIRASYDLQQESVWKTIPAKSSIAVNHTGLATLYGFESLGTGNFSFTPQTFFQTSLNSAGIKVSVDPIHIRVSKDVKVRPFHYRRTSTPTCDDDSRRQILADALADARAMAGGSATDLIPMRKIRSSVVMTLMRFGIEWILSLEI